MRTMIKNLLSFSLLALLISSCGKKTVDVLIPENAAMVFHINAASLGSKLTWDEIKNSECFKMAGKENHADDFEKKLLEDPENSGIDLKSDMYISMHMSGKNSYMVFQGKLKDVKVYETMITKAGENKEIKKDGNINYTGDKGGLVTWNNDRFIIVGQSAGYFPGNKDLYGDNDEHSITMDSVLKFAKDIYNLKKSKSIGNDSRFASLFNEKGDMHFWINSSSLIQNSMPMGMAGLFDATTLLKGNAVGYTLSFDDGKISASAKTWFNKELGDLMKKYKAGNLNTDMLKKIPGQDVAFVFAMSYPPEGLKEILQLVGVDGIDPPPQHRGSGSGSVREFAMPHRVRLTWGEWTHRTRSPRRWRRTGRPPRFPDRASDPWRRESRVSWAAAAISSRQSAPRTRSTRRGSRPTRRSPSRRGRR